MFFSNKKISGEIGYYNLEDWWLSAFTDEQREVILRVCGTGLVEGNIDWTSANSANFLWGMSGGFTRPKDREVGRIILDKAKTEALSSSDPLDMHFVLSGQITMYYRDRETHKDYYQRTIECCREQIRMQAEAARAFRKEYPQDPLPSHAGYKQLAILMEKGKKYEEAIKLCEHAKNNGWTGDWGKRIERCSRRIEKSAS